jgi:hypothetical protein
MPQNQKQEFCIPFGTGQYSIARVKMLKYIHELMEQFHSVNRGE